MHEDYELSIVYKSARLYKYLLKLLKNFPKIHRYTIGQKIDQSILNLICFCVETNFTVKPFREPLVVKALVQYELAKLLIRLAHEIGLIESERYIKIQENLNEIGKMLGGWLKYLRQPKI